MSWEAWFTLGVVALCFVLDDLRYYWVHRFGHRIRWVWASHVNHHSSQHYNLTTALRQTWTYTLTFMMVVRAPLILLEATDDERVDITLQEYVVEALAEYRELHGEEQGFEQWSSYLLRSLDKIRKRLGGGMRQVGILADPVVERRGVVDVRVHGEGRGRRVTFGVYREAPGAHGLPVDDEARRLPRPLVFDPDPVVGPPAVPGDLQGLGQGISQDLIPIQRTAHYCRNAV